MPLGEKMEELERMRKRRMRMMSKIKSDDMSAFNFFFGKEKPKHNKSEYGQIDRSPCLMHSKSAAIFGNKRLLSSGKRGDS